MHIKVPLFAAVYLSQTKVSRALVFQRSHVQFKLMTSWALVADIYFLPPQTIQEGETAVEFANRVQAMIAEVAQLRIVPWDGYLKYYNLAEGAAPFAMHSDPPAWCCNGC